MKKDKVQDKFLAELERVPIIAFACEKVDISRNTYYRWCDEDLDFALAAQERLEIGVDFVNDHAQTNILNGIKSGDMGVSKWWLSRRHKDFRIPIIVNRHTDPRLERAEEEREMKETEKRLKEFQSKWFKSGTEPEKRKLKKVKSTT